MHHSEFSPGTWESPTSMLLATDSMSFLMTILVPFSTTITFQKITGSYRTLKSSMHEQAKVFVHESQPTHKARIYRSSKNFNSFSNKTSYYFVSTGACNSVSHQLSARSAYSTDLRIRQTYLPTPPMTLAQQRDLFQERLSYLHGKVLKDDVR